MSEKAKLFEKEVTSVVMNADMYEYRLKIKEIFKRYSMEDGNTSVIFRDHENIRECLLQAAILQFPTNETYLYIEMINKGNYAGFQIERMINQYVSEVLCSIGEQDSNPESFFPMVLRLIEDNKLFCIAQK